MAAITANHSPCPRFSAGVWTVQRLPDRALIGTDLRVMVSQQRPILEGKKRDENHDQQKERPRDGDHRAGATTRTTLHDF